MDQKYDRWYTVGVEALPNGWRNVLEEDGTLKYYPCPALLMQEHRETVYVGDGESTTEQQHQPYQVRVVFADFEVTDGTLEPANAASNYVRTLGPGQEVEQ